MARYTASMEVLRFDSLRIAETGTTEYTVVMSDNGIVENDFMFNVTLNYKPGLFRHSNFNYFCRAQNVTTSSFNSTRTEYQTGGDIIALYRFVDVTSSLKESTLKVNLQASGEDMATFTMEEYPDEYREVAIFDGYDESDLFSYTESYNIYTNVWTSKTAQGTEKKFHSCISNEAGLTWTMYGQTTASYLDAVSEYNASGDSWASKTAAADDKEGAECAYIDSKIYAYGGYDGSTWFDDCNEYNISGDSWAVKTSSIYDGAYATGVNLADCLYCAYERDFNSFESYDQFYLQNTDAWLVFGTAHLDYSFVRAGAVFVDELKASFIGGSDTLSGDSDGALQNHTMVSFLTEAYFQRNDIPEARQELGAGKIGSNIIMAQGIGLPDKTDAGAYTNDAYMWQKATDTWNAIDSTTNTVGGSQGAIL